MKKLVMIGCVHTDPRHNQRLARALERYKPAVITLELSTDRLRYPECTMTHTVASGYANGKIPIHLIDQFWMDRIPEMNRGNTMAAIMKNLEASTELEMKYAKIYGGMEQIPMRIRTKIAANPFLDLEQYEIELNRDVIYGIYKRIVEGKLPLEVVQKYMDGYGLRLGEPSEAHMAREIRRLFGEMPDGTLVHVGGIFHMIEFGNEPTLYKLLMELNPERAILPDF